MLIKLWPFYMWVLSTIGLIGYAWSSGRLFHVHVEKRTFYKRWSVAYAILTCLGTAGLFIGASVMLF